MRDLRKVWATTPEKAIAAVNASTAEEFEELTQISSADMTPFGWVVVAELELIFIDLTVSAQNTLNSLEKREKEAEDRALEELRGIRKIRNNLEALLEGDPL